MQTDLMRKPKAPPASAATVDDIETAFYEALQNGDIEKLMEEKKTDEVAALIDKLIADEKLEGEAKQQITLSKLMVYGPDRLDDAAKLIDEVIAMDPESNSAEEAKALKERIADMKGEVERSKKDPDAAADEVPPSAVKEK